MSEFKLIFTDRKSVKRSPVDQRRILGEFQLAGSVEVERAVRAASNAFRSQTHIE